MRSLVWKNRYLIVLSLLPLLLTLIWFRDGRILGGGDEQFLFANTQRVLEISSTTWFEYGTGFAVLYWLSRYTFLFFANFLHTILLIPAVAIQAGSFFLLMIAGVLSVYSLVKYHVGTYRYKEYVAFLSALFYLFNPYSMSQIWGRGQYALFFSFAWLPLALLIFTKGIKERRYIYVVIFTLSSLIFSTAYGFFPFCLIQWLLLFLYICYEIIYSFKKNRRDFFPFLFFSLSLLFWICVHLWWILPLVFSGPSLLSGNITNARENIGTLLGVSQSYPFPIIVRLLQTFYFFSEHGYSPYYHILRYQVISWIPVFSLFVGIFFILRDKVFTQARFFLLILFVGFFLSSGANPPTGSLFIFFFERIPVLQMFRNPYEKAGLLYMLGYAPLFGIGFVAFLEYLFQKMKLKKVFAVIPGLLIVILLNVYLFPMWTGMIFKGSDSKIGLAIPNYVYELDTWLRENNAEYRVVMTPMPKGEGTAYQWDETRYEGIDAYTYIIDQEVVGSGGKTPYYYPYYQSLLENMQKINTRPALELLRVKYLVNRRDAELVSQNEKEQYKYLSAVIYPVSENRVAIQCDKEVQNGEDGTVTCDIPSTMTDWKNYRYLGLAVKSESPSTFELSAVDNANNRLVWDGRGMTSYQLDGLDWNTVLLPLYAPTSQNEIFDISYVTRLEIKAHPLSKPGENVKKLQIKNIYLNEGEEKHIREFLPETQIGKLDIYKPTSLVTPPEFGILTQIKPVSDYYSLFNAAEKESNHLDGTGFIITSQNTGKNIQFLTQKSDGKIIDLVKLSETRYWIKLFGGSDAYVLLSKTFYPGWKIIKGADKKVVNGSFLNNLRLLTMSVMPESSHFVVNGYANLWNVPGSGNQYAVIFIPQLFAEIGNQISITTGLILIGWLLFLQGKKYIRKKPIRKGKKK